MGVAWSLPRSSRWSAVIGAYLAADRLQASGFMAVFVFGIMLGNKESFGFKMSGTRFENSTTSY